MLKSSKPRKWLARYSFNINMMDELERSNESARKSFDSSRTASNGIARTAGLWAAALAIVWLTGLEPTLHTVKKTSQTFIEINSARQYADFRVSTRKRQLENDTQELEELKKFENMYPKSEVRAKILNNLENDYTTINRKDYQDEKDYLNATSKAKSIHDKFKSSVDKLSRSPIQNRIELIGKSAKSIEDAANELQKARLAAKDKAEKQDRNVGFELLGVNFKAPAPIAPLLWCLFCVGLLGLISNARSESIKQCTQGILELANLPDFSGRTIAHTSGRLPTWSIRPSLAVFAGIQGGGEGYKYRILVKESWVQQVFGSSDEQITADICILLMPLILLSALARVSWISLDLLRNIGPTWVRALLPIVLLINLAIMTILSRCWLSGDKLLSFRSKEKGLILGAICLAGLLSLPILLSNISFSIWLGDVLQGSLWWITITISISYALAYVTYVSSGENTMLGNIQPIKAIPVSRRRFIYALTLFGIGISLATLLSRRVSRVSQHTLPIALAPGFYKKISKEASDEKTSAEDSKSAVARKSTSRVPVLHYIGKDSRYSKRWGQQQVLKSLAKAAPPRQLDYFHDKDPPSDAYPYEPHPNAIGSPPAHANADSPRKLDYALEHEDPTDFKLSEYRQIQFGLPSLRVHLAAASWSFEEAAIALLQNGSINSRNTNKACQLLICGIQHDLVYKRRTNNSRKRTQPSFRLYDLLAGISVRFREDESFQKLLKLSREEEYEIILEPRVEKWQNVTGAWHRRWRNRQKLIKWKGSLGTAVF